LAGLENLTKLGLTGTQVTDAGLKELAPFKKLTQLDLSDEQVTNASLRTLREFGLLHAMRGFAWGKDSAYPKSADEVISFRLRGTKVTDPGLKELAPLKNLVALNLIGSKMTGAGLKDLAHLKNLATVSFDVTDASLLALGEIGLLHLLGQARAKDGSRPKSEIDVDALNLGGQNAHYGQRFKPKGGKVAPCGIRCLGAAP
jgi:internalin A